MSKMRLLFDINSLVEFQEVLESARTYEELFALLTYGERNTSDEHLETLFATVLYQTSCVINSIERLVFPINPSTRCSYIAAGVSTKSKQLVIFVQ